MKMKTGNHHFMSILRRAWNFWDPKGFVKMSAQLYWDSILTSLMWPWRIWSWKWCHFMELCLVRCLMPLLWASMMHDALFSKIYVAWSVVVLVVLKQDGKGKCIILCCVNSCKICHNGSKSLVAMLNAIYSASVVLREILVCNFLTQWMGHSQNVITYPVQEGTTLPPTLPVCQGTPTHTADSTGSPVLVICIPRTLCM